MIVGDLPLSYPFLDRVRQIRRHGLVGAYACATALRMSCERILVAVLVYIKLSYAPDGLIFGVFECDSLLEEGRAEGVGGGVIFRLFGEVAFF